MVINYKPLKKEKEKTKILKKTICAMDSISYYPSIRIINHNYNRRSRIILWVSIVIK
jgi:hypothetical protein